MKKIFLIAISLFIICFSSIANELSAINASKEMNNNLIIINLLFIKKFLSFYSS